MVAERDQVHPVAQQLVIDLRSQPGAARGVLRVGDDTVDRVFLDDAAELVGQNPPAGTAHDVADA